MGRGWGVLPFLDLTVSVGERKATRAVVVAGRVIDDISQLGFVRIALHERDPITVVDAVLALVQKNPRHGWPRVKHLTELGVNPPRTACVPVACQFGQIIAIATYPVIH